MVAEDALKWTTEYHYKRGARHTTWITSKSYAALDLSYL